jgi:predicted DNA-binding protein (UPF0251 family)
MARRKYTLPADSRDALVTKADELAAKLVASEGLDKEDAADVIGLVVETLAKIVGASEPAADAIGEAAEALATKIGEVLKPDPEVLMARAMEAMRAGKPKRSKRLMARAERVLARQAGDDGD